MSGIVFMGTPLFALPSFEKLASSYRITAAVTQPDRARDRKGNYIYSPVKQAALKKNIPVYQFEKIRAEGVETLRSLCPDLIVTCAYGQILSQEILDIPRLGVLNVHASLLPRYRGSSPLQWALINGETSTGVTIMKTDIGMDTGAVLSSVRFDIPDDMYIDGLFEKASVIGAELLANTLPGYLSGDIKPVPQNDAEATKCAMLKKEDALIDWNDSARNVRNKIRGLGYGYTFYNKAAIKIFRLDIEDENGAPGQIRTDGKKLVVYCGSGAVSIAQLQMQNKNKLDAAQFLNGTKIKSGERFSRE